MSTFVKTQLMKSGNSQGIRIPKLLIEQVGLAGEVEVEAQDGRLIIRPSKGARHGWEEQFQAMAAAEDDHLLDSETLVPTAWESEEWEW